MKKTLELFSNKRVAVLGLGISHTPLIHFLAENEAKITICDRNDMAKLQEKIDAFSEYDINYSLGNDYLDILIKQDFDYIFRTPGLRPDLPQIKKAEENGAILTSEMEMFFNLCNATIIAITGSDGKTTTTTLISEMLKKEGYTVHLGGNIGNPLLYRLGEIKKKDFVVVELSSFQLMTMKKPPSIGVITNISPNHLDYHKDYEEYIEAKKNIFRAMTGKNQIVLNVDNDVTKKFVSETKANIVKFSRLSRRKEGVYIFRNIIKYCDENILRTSKIRIPGQHNIENFMAAIAAVRKFVSIDTITYVAENFTGVEHRIEFVREHNGVKYYNDSIASSPQRTIAGLKSFGEKVILIAGGKDKGISYDQIGPYIYDYVKELILIGPTAKAIEESYYDFCKEEGIDADMKIHHLSSYEEIVKKASEIAEEGDVVLLSPASTSFDMFSNFEERGNTFKNLVMEL